MAADSTIGGVRWNVSKARARRSLITLLYFRFAGEVFARFQDSKIPRPSSLAVLVLEVTAPTIERHASLDRHQRVGGFVHIVLAPRQRPGQAVARVLDDTAQGDGRVALPKFEGLRSLVAEITSETEPLQKGARAG